MISLPKRKVYPGFPGTHLRLPNLQYPFLRNIGTHPNNSSRDEQIRQRIIQEISNNPRVLSSSNVTINPNNTSWGRKMAFFASSCCVFMGFYFTYQYYQVYTQDEDDSEPRIVFFPVWLGINWPKQRHLAFPKSLQYFDPDHSSPLGEKNFVDMVGRENVERQVLDCLFRLSIIRETFKFPISVKASADDMFDVWVEPNYCTLHGPRFSIGKTNGKVSVGYNWSIKLLKGATDWKDFVSDLTSEIASLTNTEALQNTHDKSSGRVHEANSNTQYKLLDSSTVKNQVYNIAFKGTLNVSDLKQQHTGSVSYTGIVDQSHLALSGGVRIETLTLEVSEYGKSNTLYKVK